MVAPVDQEHLWTLRHRKDMALAPKARLVGQGIQTLSGGPLCVCQGPTHPGHLRG